MTTASTSVYQEAAQLGEHAVAAVEQQACAVLLDEVAAARAVRVLPGRRLAQDRDAHALELLLRGERLRLYPGDLDATALTVLRRRCWCVGALVSGLARRSFLSLTALFVLAGSCSATAASACSTSTRARVRRDLAIVALIVILFRDGLEVEGEMLQREWHAAAAQARARDADHRARSSRWPTHALTDLAGPSRSCSARCSRRPTRCSPRAS